MAKIGLRKTEALAKAAGIAQGGVAELSEWGGEGVTWSRRQLRNPQAALAPETVEGMWYAAAVVSGMASGHVKLGFDDAGLKKAAKQLSKQLNKVIDLYDS